VQGTLTTPPLCEMVNAPMYQIVSNHRGRTLDEGEEKILWLRLGRIEALAEEIKVLRVSLLEHLASCTTRYAIMISSIGVATAIISTVVIVVGLHAK